MSLLTLDDVAERLRVSRRTVDRLVGSGRLRALYVGRARRVTAREFEAFVQASGVSRR